MSSTSPTINWQPISAHNRLTAETTDWRYTLFEYSEPDWQGHQAELWVRRAGAGALALAYKSNAYKSVAHAKRAAATWERTYTHNDGHLRHRDPKRGLRVRGWHWDPRYNLGVQ